MSSILATKSNEVKVPVNDSNLKTSAIILTEFGLTTDVLQKLLRTDGSVLILKETDTQTAILDLLANHSVLVINVGIPLMFDYWSSSRNFVDKVQTHVVFVKAHGQTYDPEEIKTEMSVNNVVKDLVFPVSTLLKDWITANSADAIRKDLVRHKTVLKKVGKRILTCLFPDG